MKILHVLFSLDFEIDVLNRYHANFYLKIPTASMIIVTQFFGFRCPPLLERQMTVSEERGWV